MSIHGIPVETAPASAWLAWNARPFVILGLAVMALPYAIGVRRLWRRAGKGHGIRLWQAVSYGAGVVALIVALLSPLDALGDVLFWAHMTQHLVLMLVAAPLLVLGAPVVASLWALDGTARREMGRWWNRVRRLRGFALLTAPLCAWTLHVATLWMWHLPVAYVAALDSETVHALEHLTFIGTALLFWWVVFPPHRHRRLDRGLTVLYLLAAGMQEAMLGALLTFSRSPWYPAQSVSSGAWGLTALQDQQLAGLLMWLPGGLVYLVAAGALFVEWLRPVRRQLPLGAFDAAPGWNG